jgi:hypothetical protein
MGAMKTAQATGFLLRQPLKERGAGSGGWADAGQ